LNTIFEHHLGLEITISYKFHKKDLFSSLISSNTSKHIISGKDFKLFFMKNKASKPGRVIETVSVPQFFLQRSVLQNNYLIINNK